ncbi:hypothetical protein LEN26_002923 [Aphanomyces euteiches]|nr:hypothetical protein AeMF1_018379 [Aphanomyces euteiches]KAH9158512.1 hypothetical protein LEN26_002923 [Aphanomyces euteiches]KAH9191068.1 hypothetical protein AeNC1_006945 [Aphanomyces euteiches]
MDDSKERCEGEFPRGHHICVIVSDALSPIERWASCELPREGAIDDELENLEWWACAVLGGGLLLLGIVEFIAVRFYL